MSGGGVCLGDICLERLYPGGVCPDTESDMKYHILRECRTSTPFKEKSSDHFEDIHKVKLLTNFDVSLTSLIERVTTLRRILLHVLAFCYRGGGGRGRPQKRLSPSPNRLLPPKNF